MADVVTTKVPHQPTQVKFVLADSLSTYYARVRHVDVYGNGPWTDITVPITNLINSGFIRGQGSIIPSLDSQVSELFSYTAESMPGGGPNSARVVIAWSDFIIQYANSDLQAVSASSFDSGFTINSDTGGSITYHVFPRILSVNGSEVEFVAPSGTAFMLAGDPSTVIAGALVQADGYVSLAGSALSFPVTVPAAGGSGGGGGGGGGCVVLDEILHTPRGPCKADQVHIGMILQGADPFLGKERWSTVRMFKVSEEMCIEIELEDSSRKRVSRSTPTPVMTEDNVKEVLAGKLCVGHKLFSRKSFSWVPIRKAADIGSQRVVRIQLEPLHWFFVGDVLSHNLRVKG